MTESRYFIGDTPVPLVGFGTLGMGGEKHIRPEASYQRDLEDEICVNTIQYAAASGLGFLCGAMVYSGGEADRLIGRAVEGLPEDVRQNTLTSTKLSMDVMKEPDSIGDVVQGLVRDKFNGRPIDLLYAAHWPFEDEPGIDIERYLPAAFECVDEGLVKAIGVSNFSQTKLEKAQEVARSLWVPGKDERHQIAAVENVDSLGNQGFGFHRTFRLNGNKVAQPGINEDMLAYCREQGIMPIAYTPFYKGKDLQNEVVLAIAQEKGIDPLHVLLGRFINKGIVAIPASRNLRHIDAIAAAIPLMTGEKQLNKWEMARLNAIPPIHPPMSPELQRKHFF